METIKSIWQWLTGSHEEIKEPAYDPNFEKNMPIVGKCTECGGDCILDSRSYAKCLICGMLNVLTYDGKIYKDAASLGIVKVVEKYKFKRARLGRRIGRRKISNIVRYR